MRWYSTVLGLTHGLNERSIARIILQMRDLERGFHSRSKGAQADHHHRASQTRENPSNERSGHPPQPVARSENEGAAEEQSPRPAPKGSNFAQCLIRFDASQPPSMCFYPQFRHG
jgi:hypothetical protein